MTDFALPDEDLEYLRANFPKQWRKVCEGSKHGIIIAGYHLPDLYTPDQPDLMLIIPADYPTGMIDMFYFSPEVSRKDGTAINALAIENHFGCQWQRWSRHYTWEPGTHSIVSHISYVYNQLKYEK